MREEIKRLEIDLKNTTLEIANIEKMKRHLKWFVVLGGLASPIGFFWHFFLFSSKISLHPQEEN